jgi:hypothetical protein
MKLSEDGSFSGERALYMTKGAEIRRCRFFDGESPLKESRDLLIKDCHFEWKYPLWYCKDVRMEDSEFALTARSGIWYTENIEIKGSAIHAPKTFRRAKGITLRNDVFDHGEETLWGCEDIDIEDVYVKGDYFGMNSSHVRASHLRVDGNYIFDGGKDIVITDSALNSKDAFWNCEDVTLERCTIIGEYLSWNTKSITLRDCHIESHQGMCYVDGLVLERCEITNSDLIFEYSNVHADVTTVIDSVKNPLRGIIKAKGIKDLILDGNMKGKKEDTEYILGDER